MDTRVPPLPMDPGFAAKLRQRGSNPGKAEKVFARVMSYTHYALPDPPASVDAHLSALLPHDSVDRLSRLPDVLLANIVARIPVKEAARTAAFSRRWRGVWRNSPLVLVDSQILPAGTAVARVDARRITSGVSRVFAAHPGPFRCVYLTSSCMEDFHGLLTRWLEILADKGIEELVLVNRPWPLDLVLPATFLGMTTLTRLYLGLWKFPDTAGVPRATCFPNLRELGLCVVLIESSDLDFILDRSPVLETLSVQGNLFKLSLRLVSQSLRCLQFIGCFVDEIAVVHAPSLERLILSLGWTRDGVCTKVKIGHAPKLHSFGYLDSGVHVLEVGNIVIKAGTKATPSTMVPSVKILALKFRCGARNDVKMIPAILGCFPNVESLHIMSRKNDQTSAKLNPKFWNECGTIDCIRSSIKMLVFNDYRWDRSELAFLKFFYGSSVVLKKVAIVLADNVFTSEEEVNSKMMTLQSIKRASADCKTLVTGCSDPEGGNIWSFKRASDFSRVDPFEKY